jgi:hypothetical protein
MRLRRRPFPDGWRGILRRNLPYLERLSDRDIEELQGHIQVFLAEKSFEGCGGLEMSDEIRVTIAAQACMLLLHRDADCYPTLRSILVYPHAYAAWETKRLPDGTVLEGPSGRLGESWYRGSVVLSWEDVRTGAADIHDGHNVVFHEFAHQLDSESGANEGAPRLDSRTAHVAWARVLGHEYRALVDEVAKHHKTVLDRYAATSPAEFFAVATECFFEKPVQLRQRHPDLYGQLSAFYRQDPATPGEGSASVTPQHDPPPQGPK